jgi:hypothetical protein
MQPLHSTSASRRDVAGTQLVKCADLRQRGQGRATDYACLDGFSRRDTTQQRNTHIRDVREICYCFHPWHGRPVRVHASFVKRGQPVAYCSLEDVNSRVLEVPLWMLDVAACSKTQVSKPGLASTQSLRELKQVLESARLRVQAQSRPEPQHRYLQDAKGADGGVADPTATEPISIICSSPVQSALDGPVVPRSTKDGAMAGAVTPAASSNKGRKRNRTEGVR